MAFIGFPLAFGLIGIEDWASTPEYKVTIFEHIVWYIVMPILAAVGFVLGCYIVRGVSRDLRNGDFIQDGEE